LNSINSQKKVVTLSEELAELESKSLDMNSKWQAAKSQIQISQKIKEDLENAKIDLYNCFILFLKLNVLEGI
jgi:ATP-dependent Clp protease ATP-binding subunit ClpB